MRTAVILFGAVLLFGACGRHTPVDATFLTTYAGDPENGLIRTRAANGITTTVHIVPPALCALQEFADDSCAASLPQVLAAHQQQLRVIVELAPDTAHFRGDVMTYGARDLEQYIQNAYQLNFEWEHMVELRCGEHTYTPVLSTLENTYGLSQARKVMLVFVPAETGDTDFTGSPVLDVVLENTVFGTGIQHFRFSRTDLSNVPQPTT